MKKKWYIRAIRTFVQTFFGTLASSCALIDWSDTTITKTILFGLFASATASAVSAMMNYLDEKKEDDDDGNAQG